MTSGLHSTQGFQKLLTKEYLDPQSMQNNGLLGYFWWLWAVIPTLGVQVVLKSYRGSCYNLRYLPNLRAFGRSGRSFTNLKRNYIGR